MADKICCLYIIKAEGKFIGKVMKSLILARQNGTGCFATLEHSREISVLGNIDPLLSNINQLISSSQTWAYVALYIHKGKLWLRNCHVHINKGIGWLGFFDWLVLVGLFVLLWYFFVVVEFIYFLTHEKERKAPPTCLDLDHWYHD